MVGTQVSIGKHLSLFWRYLGLEIAFLDKLQFVWGFYFDFVRVISSGSNLTVSIVTEIIPGRFSPSFSKASYQYYEGYRQWSLL